MFKQLFGARPNQLVFAFNCAFILLLLSMMMYVKKMLVLHTWLDFILIISYAQILWTLFTLNVPGNKSLLKNISDRWIRLAKIAVIAVVCSDVVENIMILISHSSNLHIPGIITALTVTKSVLLIVSAFAIIISALPWLSEHVLKLLTGIIQFRFVVFSIALTFFILWASDQGRDLLLSLNGRKIGPVLSLFLIALLSVCNWFLPKYYIDEPSTTITLRNFLFGSWDFKDDANRRSKKYISRMLGAAGFIIPGVSILHAMQIFQVHYYLEFIDPFFLMIILLILYGIILKKQWKTLCNRKIVLTTGIITILFIVITSFVPLRPSTFLGMLAIDCFLLSFVFLLYANVRNVNSGAYKQKALEKPITPFVIMPTFAVSLAYFVINFNPLWMALPEQYRFITLPVVFSAIIFYLFTLSFLRLIGKKYKVHIITLILLLMFVLVNVIPNDFHRVKHYSAGPGKIDTVPLQDLNTYSDNWLAQRKSEIDSFHKYFRRPYPIFLVNAYGGGIRAAAWTGKYIHHLDTLVYNTWLRSNSPYLSTRFDFQHYVFSYSGASGGTMGAAVLCAQRYAQLTAKPVSPHTDSLFFSNDFLTPVIVPLLGRDIWFAFTGQQWVEDRARIQERTWEYHAKTSQPSFSLDQKMSSFWNNPSIPGEVPLLFSNSYLLDSGLKAIVAPVKLDPVDFPATYLVNNRVGGRSADSQELRLSTAALLSARFPFISPAGELDDFHHFMDGGLKENSGAETSAQLRVILQRALDRRGWTPDSVRIIMLSVNNSVSPVDSVQIAKNVFELSAPLTALMNNWVGNTIKADALNEKDTATGHYRYFAVRPECSTDSSNLQPVLPLGWQISDASLTFMDRCLKDPRVARVSNKIVDIITRDVSGSQ
jgi:hypothetical protein